MHNLKLDEAIRKAEIAIRDALVAGDLRLRVICGLGSRWDRRERELPHLRLALTKALSECVALSLLAASISSLIVHFTPHKDKG